MSDRSEIAAAFTSVADINCAEYYRQSTKPGDAYVRIGAMQAAANGFGYVTQWEVVLVLPQDLAAGEQFLEAKHPLIAQALKRVWIPVSVTPAELIIGTGTVNGAIYAGAR